jgi:serine/threonine protein kinase/Leucine-rich repeat (LRR) protein
MNELERLIRGDLPVEEIDRLAEDHADDPAIETVANSVQQAGDTLIDSLHPFSPIEDEVQELTSRLLQKLQPQLSVEAVSGTLVQPGVASNSVDALPKKLGRFEIQSTLGHGGMGVVSLAWDPIMTRSVAIKTVKRSALGNQEARDRFLREARCAGKLHHAHIVPIHDVGEDEGYLFIVMPVLEGVTFDRYLRQLKASGQKLTAEQIIFFARQIAAGLAKAHAAGLIHRDIKPGNLWLQLPEQQLLILDFGLVKSSQGDQLQTQSGMIVGTPAYMAPEQGRGSTVDSRADLFSLGCILFEMATGGRAFAGESTMAVLTQVANDNPPPVRSINPEIPVALEALIQRLLEKNPQHRPANAEAVILELDQIDKKTRVPAWNRPTEQLDSVLASTAIANSNPAPTLVQPPPAATNRKRLLWLLCVIVLLVGGVFAYELTFKTANGTLIVEIDDPEVQARFQNGRLEITDPTGKRTYALKPSDKNQSLPAGEYRITVKDAEGLTVDTDRFELSTGDRVTVRVTLGKNEFTAKPPVESKSDRDTAHWVLSLGGTVGIRENDKVRILQDVRDLPASGVVLEQVDLHSTKSLSDADLGRFSNCQSLRSLSLNGCPVGDAGMVHLGKLTKLQVLNLFDTQVTDVGLKSFAEFRDLEELVLRNDKITDAGLNAFQKCRNLRRLVAPYTQITDATLTWLGRCEKLTILGLGGPQVGVTDAGIEKLAPLKLTELRVQSANIGDRSLSVVAGFSQLQTLALDGTSITDAGLSKVKLPASLTWIDFTNTRIGDSILLALRDCTNITFLNLGQTKVTDAGLKIGTALRSLHVLNLAQCVITDTGLAHFRDSGSLRNLDLSDTAITDIGLQLLELKSLQSLDAKGTKVTDRIFEPLSKTKIQSLNLIRTSVSSEGVQRFRRTLPSCRLDWDGGTLESKPLLDREAALLVLSAGGEVTIVHEEQEKSIRKLAELPMGAVTLRGIRMLGSNKLTDADLPKFADCRELLVLDLSRSPLTDAGMKSLKHLDRLKFLDLSYTQLTDAGLFYFKGCKQLEKLHLISEKFSDHGLAFFAECRQLSECWVNATQISDETLAWLGKNLDLKGLNLSHTRITDLGLAHLKNLTKLETLNLHATRITGAGLKHFTDLSQLRDLDLGSIKQLGRGGISFLSTCRELNSLHVEVSDVTDEDLAACKNLTKITSLFLYSTRVTDAALAHFANCPELHEIYLGDTQITDAGMKHFKNCKELWSLVLNGTKVSDVGLTELNFDRMNSLLVDRTRVGDVTMERLLKVKDLRSLHATGSRVTPKMIERIKTQFPACRIEWDGGVIEPK